LCAVCVRLFQIVHTARAQFPERVVRRGGGLKDAGLRAPASILIRTINIDMIDVALAWSLHPVGRASQLRRPAVPERRVKRPIRVP
jgi:hypothetical protein